MYISENKHQRILALACIAGMNTHAESNFIMETSRTI